MSHSTRVRGLKFSVMVGLKEEHMSHSTRVRGLKYSVTPPNKISHSVALYTSAWIEIADKPTYRKKGGRRTLHECVD